MSRINKKMVFVVFFVLSLVLPLAAFASYYNFVYDFTHMLQSREYSMNGSNIEIYFNSSQYVLDKNMTIKLYRSVFGPDDYIGSKSIPTSGGTVRFPNVGKGTYYFEMWKAQDGREVIGSGYIKNY